MEIKYKKLEVLVGVLSRLAKECKLPISYAASARRLAKAIDSDAIIYYDLKDSLIKEFSEKDKDGEMVYEKQEVNGKMVNIGIKLVNPTAFVEKINELGEVSFNVDFLPIPTHLIDDFKLTTNEFEELYEILFV
jgi:hypothetical protein